MVMPPGYRQDLDVLVDKALADNTPNALVEGSRKFVEDHWENDTLLVAVAIHGRLDLVDRLFAAGAQMTAADFHHVLWWSCGAGTAAYLLERGAPRDQANLNSYLETALRHEQWDTIFVLLNYGADVETSSDKRVRLLHVAAWKGESFVVRRLLQRGAEVDCRDAEAMTPLMKACDWKEKHHAAGADTVYWLLTHGANPNAQNPDGENPLLLCTSEKLDWFAYAYRTQTAQLLLRFGANPNAAVPKLETTALMFAARDDDVMLARALLRAGADKSMKTPDGRTARDIAEQRGSQDVLALL